MEWKKIFHYFIKAFKEKKKTYLISDDNKKITNKEGQVSNAI